jgi:hypothetical protein
MQLLGGTYPVSLPSIPIEYKPGSSLLGGTCPVSPFPYPIALVTDDPGTGVLVDIQINQNWIPLIIGSMMVLLNASTWSTSQTNALFDMRDRVVRAMNIIGSFNPVPPPIEFRVKPDDTAHWQYSLDSGVNWLNGPATSASLDSIISDPSSGQMIAQPDGTALTVATAIGNLALDIWSGLTDPPTSRSEAILRVDKKIDDAIALFEVLLVP